ncbi:MAG: signal peptidase II [Pirellulaceae bacterium]|nr:signal peptidase II [Pirellulaceae bacterium]
MRWCFFAAIAVAGAISDLWTKQRIFEWLGLPGESPPYWLLEPYAGLETTVNPGALFGMGAGWGSVFALMACLACVVILVWMVKYRAIESWWLTVSLAMVLGGIVGNLHDRLGLWNPPLDRPEWASGVRDWILLRYGEFTWPNFNIADSLLVCGAILLAVHSFLYAPSGDAKIRSNGRLGSS